MDNKKYVLLNSPTVALNKILEYVQLFSTTV